EEMDRRARHAMEAGAAHYTQRFRLIRAGRIHWIHESVSIVRHADGHFELVGVATDITPQIEIEARFRGAFDFAGIGMALVGLDGSWLKVNPALCRILGYSVDELMQATFQDITHPDDLAGDLEHVNRLIV